MKKFVLLLCIILVIFFAYQKIPAIHHLLSYSPCNTPLTYKLGDIDARFNLTTDQVLSDTREAAEIWNNELQKPIFLYSSEGGITINLVYDKRQELSTQVNQLQQQLDTDKGNLDPQIEDYKKKSAAFDQKAAALNQDISYWNSRGGAPEAEYNQLMDRQKKLQNEAQELNRIARTLNQSATDYNSQIGQLNQTEDQLTQTLALKPEEGLYNGNDNTISIYFNNSKNELIHTLAHELGHARGLDHNNNSDSVMYPSSTEDITLSQEDIASLAEICKEQSDLYLIINGYANFIHSLETKFQPVSN
jgi:hypothetical protein